MFGEKIDYRLLKPLAHARNRATEEELNLAVNNTSFTRSDANAYFKSVNRRFYPPFPDTFWVENERSN